MNSGIVILTGNARRPTSDVKPKGFVETALLPTPAKCKKMSAVKNGVYIVNVVPGLPQEINRSQLFAKTFVWIM